MPYAALVTGASRGLGRGISVALAQAGWSVAINYASNAAAAAECRAACSEAAPTTSQSFPCFQADVSDPGQRQRLLSATLNELGDIDALVNNAGIAPPVRADILAASEQSFAKVVNTNLAGPHFLTQLVARHWLEDGAGREKDRSVVFVTSVSATYASVNRAEYCISKAGLAMACQLWATRLAPHRINVYELRPGIMATDMTVGVKEKYDGLIAAGLVPQGRWGSQEDVGLAVVALLAGSFRFSAGAIVNVDGGFSLRRL